jgi:hypothetical protein
LRAFCSVHEFRAYDIDYDTAYSILCGDTIAKHPYGLLNLSEPCVCSFYYLSLTWVLIWVGPSMQFLDARNIVVVQHKIRVRKLEIILGELFRWNEVWTP